MKNPLRNVSTVLKLASLISQIQDLNKQGVPMLKYIPVIITLTATLASALAAPDFVAHHATVYAVLNGLAQLLHAVLPSVASAQK